jgi:hypothetical protein
MTRYRSVWLIPVYLLGVVGGVLACVSMPVTTLCWLSVSIVGLSAAHHLFHLGRYQIGNGVTLGTVAATGAAGLAAIGLTSVVGGAAVGLTLLLAASSPAALTSYLRCFGRSKQRLGRALVLSATEDSDTWRRYLTAAVEEDPS